MVFRLNEVCSRPRHAPRAWKCEAKGRSGSTWLSEGPHGGKGLKPKVGFSPEPLPPTRSAVFGRGTIEPTGASTLKVILCFFACPNRQASSSQLRRHDSIGFS